MFRPSATVAMTTGALINNNWARRVLVGVRGSDLTQLELHNWCEGGWLEQQYLTAILYCRIIGENPTNDYAEEGGKVKERRERRGMYF